MKHILTVISCLLAFNLTAQEVVVEYPYNPDFENDGNVGVEDLLQLLAYFDMGFEADDIVIDEVTLTQWLQTISQTLIAQQAAIDSLHGLTSALDSTMVADMIAAAGGAGGCNYTLSNIKYPQGLVGETIIARLDSANDFTYTVPSGKNLYIYAKTYGPLEVQLHINGIDYGPIGDLVQYFTMFGAGEVISIGPVNTDEIGIQFVGYVGFLINSGPVSSVDIAFSATSSEWIVPDGKYFVPQRFNLSGPQADEILLDGESFCVEVDPNCKWMGAGLNNRAVIGSGSTFSFVYGSNTEPVCNLRGYLVDEDYFADCGGGVGSIENGGGGGELGPCQGELTVNYHGYDYELVEIGNQCWFAEDLQTSTFSNGDEIEQNWNWANFDDPWGMPTCQDHGGWIYNGPARIDQRNLCPADFKVPTESDWSELMGKLYGQHLTSSHMNYSGINLHSYHQDYNNDATGDCVELSVGGGYYGLEYDEVVLPQGIYPTYTGAYVLGNQWHYLEATEALGMYIRCIKD